MVSSEEIRRRLEAKRKGIDPVKIDKIKFCPKCGAENSTDANFCRECGKKFHSEKLIRKEERIKKTNNIGDYQEIRTDEDSLKGEYIDFVYVIFLERANGHYEGYEFPKYFKYNYGANTNSLLKKALRNNHLAKSKPSYNVEKANVSEIKKILKKHNLKVSGRKKELIERIIANLSEKEIKAEFPRSYFVLTDKGRNIVKKNDHIIYYHKSMYLRCISLEKYHDLIKDKSDTNSKYDIALELLEEYALKERKKGNWGLYRNSFHAKANVYEDKNEYEVALDNYLKICLLDLSGLSNNNQYLQTLIMLAPGIINEIEELCFKLELDINVLKKRYFKCFKELNLPKTKLSKEQSFKRLFKELSKNFGKDLNKNLKPQTHNNNLKKSTQRKSEDKDGISFVNIEVKRVKNLKKRKAKYLFEDKSLFAEEVAIKYYENQGYNAMWTENYYWWFLMALVFWDEIFAPIKGAFNSFELFTRMNDMPKDFFRPEFYLRRKNLINNKIMRLKNGDLEAEILKSYKKNYGKSCRPIEDWNRYTINELLIPIKRMDKTTFLGILERLISNFNENRRGLPDLIVFNDDKLFFSEVKGENDRISDKQREWHRFLVEKMKLKVDLFLLNHSERKTKNVKSSYLFLNEEYRPEGDLNDFKVDLELLKKFIANITKKINERRINVTKNENINRKMISEIREIRKVIQLEKREFNKKLKVLNSDIIIVTHVWNRNNPNSLKFNINADKEILNQYVEYYKKYQK